MSQIFDALQRSEVERSNVEQPNTGPSTLPEVTELLRLAERREATKWETAGLSGQSGASETSRNLAARDIGKMPTVVDAPRSSEGIDVGLSQNHFDVLSQFKALPIALTADSRLSCITDSGSPAAEAFRLLGVRIRHLRRERRQLKRVLITSTIPQEGKSMVTANLSCTLALKTTEKVLVMEGDLRRPSLLQMFGVKKKPGLTEWLESECDLATIVYHLPDLNIWILPAGSAPSNALELLQSTRLSTLMQQLTQMFDWIVIDSPPILPLADTSVWMRLADGIILVTRQGTTEKRKLQRGVEAIEPEKLIGALINSSSNLVNNGYYSYYGPKDTETPIHS